MRGVFFTVIIGLLAGGVSAADDCDRSDIAQRQRFDRAEFVVLANATESTYPKTSENPLATFDGTATLVVIKSWKGPYLPGATIKTGPPDIATGSWNPHPVQVGDEVLIFARLPYPMLIDPTKFNPVWLEYCNVTDVAHAAMQIAFLDSVAKTKASRP